MSDTVGSIRKVTIDSIGYNAAADANITEMGSKFENSAIATSGPNMRKMVKRVDVREGVTLITNSQEKDTLLRVSEDPRRDIPMSYEQANGDKYRGRGWIEVEGRETEEGKLTIKMFPRLKFDLFVA